MILSFYSVIAGWAFGYAFEEIFYFLGWNQMAELLTNTGNGWKNALLAVIFMLATIKIITGGVSEGIEKATKTMMPLLIGIIITMILYVLTQDGAMEGVREYLLPDFSRITTDLIFSAMGQAFFSLSLGMGALITYGSYLSKKENIPQLAAFVTLADVGIAFLAGLLIIPAMYVARSAGIEIFVGDQLASSTDLVFQILPALFHTIGGFIGVSLGVVFSCCWYCRSNINDIIIRSAGILCYDEHKIERSKSAWFVGLGVTIISVIIAFRTSLIGSFSYIFSDLGLPIGGLFICLFIAFVWKKEQAFNELEHGFSTIKESLFAKIWPLFLYVICPAAIAYNIISNFL